MRPSSPARSAAHPPQVDACGDQPLARIVHRLQEVLARSDSVVLLVPDPDVGAGLWPGERRPDGAPQRSWRAWLDLAEALGTRMGTPLPLGDGRVRVRFERLPAEAPFHADGRARGLGTSDEAGDDALPEHGGYGRASAFARLRKLEHPGFLLPLLDALAFARPPDGARVLVLGCHAGDEVAALDLLAPSPLGLRVLGVDREAEALAEARVRHPRADFLETDVNELPRDLGRFELIVSIGLLQSPAVDDRRLVRTLVQEHATPSGGLVLGVPNGRFRGGEALWGARTRNHREVDLSLVVKDLAAHRRYLHQHGYRSRIGGRYDLLLAARRRAG